jgi:hypothetical protein
VSALFSGRRRQHASRKLSTSKEARGKGRDRGRGEGKGTGSENGRKTHLNSTEDEKKREK